MEYATCTKWRRCMKQLDEIHEIPENTILGIVISWKSLVFPLIYFHVNEQWTAKPIRHTRQPISSLIQTRSRNNSTKRCFQENCFLSFVSNHSCNILSNSSLTNGTFVYIPSLPPVCVLQFSRFVFWFRDLFLVELTDMPWRRMYQSNFHRNK